MDGMGMAYETTDHRPETTVVYRPGTRDHSSLSRSIFLLLLLLLLLFSFPDAAFLFSGLRLSVLTVTTKGISQEPVTNPILFNPIPVRRPIAGGIMTSGYINY